MAAGFPRDPKLTMSRFSSLLTGCLLLAASVPLAFVAAKEAPKRAAKTPAETPNGLVWKIEGGKVPVYLVGSFHLLRKQDLPPPATVDQAYADSEQLWFEVPPKDMEDPKTQFKMMSQAALPPDKSLKDVVKPATLAKVEAWEGDPAMKLVLSRMKPWMVALTITMTEYQKMGADPAYGLEKTMEKRATKDKKTTDGFETADFQIGLFAKLTDEQQDEMLSQSFDELKSAKKMIDDMIKAWKVGDPEGLAKLMDEGFKDHPDLKKLLLTDRNASWVEPIENLLKGDKKTMVMVGAGHLCGPESVVELLEKRGWKLQRLESQPKR